MKEYEEYSPYLPEKERSEMDYEALVEEIKMQCARKQILFYILSKISGVPQSTDYYGAAKPPVQ